MPGTGDSAPALRSSQANRRHKCGRTIVAVGLSSREARVCGAGTEEEDGVSFNLRMEIVRHRVTENLSL